MLPFPTFDGLGALDTLEPASPAKELDGDDATALDFLSVLTALNAPPVASVQPAPAQPAVAAGVEVAEAAVPVVAPVSVRPFAFAAPAVNTRNIALPAEEAGPEVFQLVEAYAVAPDGKPPTHATVGVTQAEETAAPPPLDVKTTPPGDEGPRPARPESSVPTLGAPTFYEHVTQTFRPDLSAQNWSAASPIQSPSSPPERPALSQARPGPNTDDANGDAAVISTLVESRQTVLPHVRLVVGNVSSVTFDSRRSAARHISDGGTPISLTSAVPADERPPVERAAQTPAPTVQSRDISDLPSETNGNRPPALFAATFRTVLDLSRAAQVVGQLRAPSAAGGRPAPTDVTGDANASPEFVPAARLLRPDGQSDAPMDENPTAPRADASAGHATAAADPTDLHAEPAPPTERSAVVETKLVEKDAAGASAEVNERTLKDAAPPSVRASGKPVSPASTEEQAAVLKEPHTRSRDNISREHAGTLTLSESKADAVGYTRVESSVTDAEVPRKVAAQVAQAVSEAATEKDGGRDSRSFRLRLNPEKLGEVEIHITGDGEGRLHVRLTAEREATHEALSGELTHLRETLERTGLNVGRLEAGLGFTATDAGPQGDARPRQPAASYTAAPGNTPSTPEAEDGPAEEKLVSLRA